MFLIYNKVSVSQINISTDVTTFTNDSLPKEGKNSILAKLQIKGKYDDIYGIKFVSPAGSSKGQLLS